jgi:hypothetical protein
MGRSVIGAVDRIAHQATVISRRPVLRPARFHGRLPEEPYQAGVVREVGIWRGPTGAAWVTRILDGAPMPRRSTGIRPPALVAHG